MNDPVNRQEFEPQGHLENEKDPQIQDLEATGSAAGVIREYLSYEDTNLGDDEKQAVYERQVESNETWKYAEALHRLFQVKGKDAVMEEARQMRDKSLGTLQKAGITPREYDRSVSWAMQDLGRQEHYYPEAPETDSRERTEAAVEQRVGEATAEYLQEHPQTDSVDPDLQQSVREILEKDEETGKKASQEARIQIGKLVNEYVYRHGVSPEALRAKQSEQADDFKLEG